MNDLDKFAFWEAEQLRRINAGNLENRKRIDKLIHLIQTASQGRIRAEFRVLNIGIGNALMERKLLAAGYYTCSLDPSEKSIAELQAMAPEFSPQFKVGTCQSIPFPDGHFDVLVMSEVIEHIDEAGHVETMREIRRVLKPGGLFLGTCPDDEDLASKIQTCPHCNTSFHPVGHIRSFTPASLRRRLELDFEVLVCKSFFGMNLNWKGRTVYFLKTLPYLLRRGLVRKVRIPQGLGRHILFKARTPAS